MSALEMPVRSDLKAYRFTTELEGQIYLFRFNYNARMARWFMDILTTEQVVIISGIVLLTNLDLLGQYKIEALPPGGFVVIDETGQNRNPGPDNFGSDIKLIYVESGDLV